MAGDGRGSKRRFGRDEGRELWGRCCGPPRCGHRTGLCWDGVAIAAPGLWGQGSLPADPAELFSCTLGWAGDTTPRLAQRRDVGPFTSVPSPCVSQAVVLPAVPEGTKWVAMSPSSLVASPRATWGCLASEVWDVVSGSCPCPLLRGHRHLAGQVTWWH